MVKKTLYENGFLIKERDNETEGYHGVEGYWPIYTGTEGLEMDEKIYLDEYCENNIYEPSNEDDTVGVCTDKDYLNRYLDACRKAEIKVEVLFCSTDRPYPENCINIENFKEKFEFLGYDYAYPGALYYSCIYNDIGRINEFDSFKLNKYGLINTYDELLKFIEMRENLKVKYPYTFELGDFVIYKVCRYTALDLYLKYNI